MLTFVCPPGRGDAEVTVLPEEKEGEFYLLRPVIKTDHMQQGINGLAYH